MTTTQANAIPPQPPAPLVALVPSVIVWFAVVVGHFLLCAKLAHWLGNPASLPPSLAGVDRLFSYGISGFLHVLLILVWMAIVGGTLVAMGLAVFVVAALLPAKILSAVSDGMLCLIPVAGLTLLTLLILPMYSHNQPADPSGLDLAEVMPFDAYLETLYTGLIAIVTIVLLFAGLFLTVMLMNAVLPDGGVWQLFVAIFVGIAVAITFGMLAGPFVLKISQRYGAVRAIVGFLATWALLTSGPVLIVTRLNLILAEKAPQSGAKNRRGAG